MNFMTADVEIKVDDSGVPAQLNRVKSSVSKTVDKIGAIFKRMGAAFKSAFVKMVRVAKWGAVAIAGALTLATRAAMKQEDAMFLLDAALKISGDYTKELSEKFREFASEVQQTTIYGDEFVLALMQQQKSLGVTADKLEEASKMAIGLATATGRGVDSMSMYIALAMQGEFTMLRRYIPALRATTDATEQLKIVQEFAAAGFKLAEERAKTSSGALRQMWNALGDVAEVIGKALLPGLKDTAIAIKEWAERNQKRISEWADIVATKIGIVINKVWELVKFLTTDFKKGMVVLKNETVAVFMALIDSFLILGDAAASSFVKAFGESLGKWLAEIGKPEGILGKLGMAVPTITISRLALMKAGIDLVESARLDKPINAVQRLGDAWEKVGEEISKASSAPQLKTSITVGTTPGIFGGGSIGEILDRQPEAPLIEPTVDYEGMKESAQEHTEWLRSMDDMSLDEKISNLDTMMELKRSSWTEESEAYEKLNDERKRYVGENVKGFVAMGKAMRTWAVDSINWGKKLGDILTSTVSNFANTLADSLVDGAANWRDFGKSIIKMLVAMIVKLTIAAALMAILNPGAPAAASASVGSMLANVGSSATMWGSKATGGYIERTGMYRIHQGEQVLTKTQQTADSEPWTVNINNPNVAGLSIDAEFDTKEKVIDIVIEAADTDGPFRAALGLV